MVSAAKSKKLAIAERRQQVARLYVQGWSQVEIATKLGVVQGTISSDLKQIQHDWRESAVRDFDEAKMIELKKLDRIERECWEAWERSQKPAQSADINGPGNEPTKKRIRNQYGDPRFLDQIQKCISARRNLLGLDAPTKIAPTTPDGNSAYQDTALVVDRLSDAQFKVLQEAREIWLQAQLHSKEGISDGNR